MQAAKQATPPPPRPENPRSSPRNPVFWQARVVCQEQGVTIECRLRNLSETGARLEIDGAVPLPATFDIVAPAKGKTWRARCVWRQGGETGVAFIRDTAADTHLDPDARIRELEAQNEILLAKLKAMAVELAARVARDGVA